MIKFLQIIILISFLTIQITAQPKPSMVRFDFPQYVQAEKNFEVSAVFKFSVKPTESFILNFSKSHLIFINSVFIFYNGNRNNLKIENSNINPDGLSVEVDVEKYNIEDNTPYQIIFSVRNSGVLKTSDALFSYTGELDKDSDFFEKQNKKNKISNIDFYKIQETAGNSLGLRNKSNFEINYQNMENDVPLYFEFWMKSSGDLNNLLNIINLASEDTLFKISKNLLGFVSTPFNHEDIERNDIYLSNSVWDYFGIYLKQDFNDVILKLYVNSKLAVSRIVRDKTIKNKLRFNFVNENSENDFEIDRIRLSQIGNNLNLFFNNKHYLTFEADSSRRVAIFNFDEKSELSNFPSGEQISIKYQNTDFTKSTAPIFSRAPKLTVTIGSSYNSIVWYVQEFYAAKEFVLEKSTNNNSFEKVFQTFADDDPLKIYYYTDNMTPENEVAYYRLKQINKDGSEVYSAEVKIGHKNTEEFILKQNYPNPFNPITSIYVDVITAEHYEINVYDLVGNTVAQLHKGYLGEGLHTFEFNAANLPSGIYFYEVISPKSHAVKKMILAK